MHGMLNILHMHLYYSSLEFAAKTIAKANSYSIVFFSKRMEIWKPINRIFGHSLQTLSSHYSTTFFMYDVDTHLEESGETYQMETCTQGNCVSLGNIY